MGSRKKRTTTRYLTRQKLPHYRSKNPPSAATVEIPAGLQAESPPYVRTLEAGYNSITSIACISSTGIGIGASSRFGVAVTSDDNAVRIFSLYPSLSRPSVVFKKHTDSVESIMQLKADVLVSADHDGNVITYDTSFGRVMGEVNIGNELTVRSMAKLDAATFIVGTTTGALVTVKHKDGYSLAKDRTININTAHESGVHDIFTMENTFFITASFDKTAVIWDAGKFEKLATLKHETMVTSAAATSKLIVTGGTNGKLYVHKNTAGEGEDVNTNTSTNKYPLVSTVEMRNLSIVESRPGWVVSLTFINLDVVMVTTQQGGIYFVSLSKRSCITHMKPTAKSVCCSTVLPDGKICVGGANGYCAILSVPSKVHHAVTSFAKRLHPEVQIISADKNGASSDDAEISVKENSCSTVATRFDNVAVSALSEDEAKLREIMERKEKNAVFKDISNTAANRMANKPMSTQSSDTIKKNKKAFLQEMVKEAKKKQKFADTTTSKSPSLSTSALLALRAKKCNKLLVPQDKWTARENTPVYNVLCTPPRDISIMPNGINASQKSNIGKYTLPPTKTPLRDGTGTADGDDNDNTESSRAISVPVNVTTSLPETACVSVPTAKPEDVGEGETTETAECEDTPREALAKLKRAGLVMNNIASMCGFELAAVLAAYLVLYELDSADCFAAIRSELGVLFKTLFINGAIFAHGGAAETEWLSKKLIDTLRNMYGADAIVPLKFTLRRFMRAVNPSPSSSTVTSSKGSKC